MKDTDKFLNLLKERGMIEEKVIPLLSSKFASSPEGLIHHLLAEGIGSRNSLGATFGDAIGFTYVDIQKTLIQSDLIELLPEETAKRFKVIFLHRFGTKITVATAEPLNYIMLDEVAALTGVELSPVYAPVIDIEEMIEIHYNSTDNLDALTKEIAEMTSAMDGEVGIEEIKAVAGSDAVIHLTRVMILLALKDRASDIHIQPWETGVRIRFRIDGVLHERFRFESSLLEPIVACLKIIAGADIIETRRPQDGRISFDLGNQSVDIRFSSIPTVDGEKVVLRLLGQINRREIPDLVELDLAAKHLESIHKVMDTPNGVFFVTGPTGSGKTTTLYSALKHINKPGINISTVEDPVEYRLPGTSQVQVNPAVGLDFCKVLRSFLRQDPDVILLGEVRDIESAKIASQAALTGHLVLSTMHTNNALQAVTRLIEIGVEPFLVAPSIIAVMAQRLVRRLCESCKESYQLSAEEVAERFITEDGAVVEMFRPKGCIDCNNTGYHGRIAVHEIFMLGDEVRQLISRNASILDIRDVADSCGYEALEYDGLKKALRGLTSLEEVDRLCAEL